MTRTTDGARHRVLTSAPPDAAFRWLWSELEPLARSCGVEVARTKPDEFGRPQYRLEGGLYGLGRLLCALYAPDHLEALRVLSTAVPYPVTPPAYRELADRAGQADLDSVQLAARAAAAGHPAEPPPYAELAESLDGDWHGFFGALWSLPEDALGPDPSVTVRVWVALPDEVAARLPLRSVKELVARHDLLGSSRRIGPDGDPTGWRFQGDLRAVAALLREVADRG